MSSACCRISCTDRKSTRLNSSHGYISYAVFCLKKKNNNVNQKKRLQLTKSSTTTPGTGVPSSSEGRLTRNPGFPSSCCASPAISISFFNDTATTEIYTLSLHDALPICCDDRAKEQFLTPGQIQTRTAGMLDRKSTRLNSSHGYISYPAFRLKKHNT